MIAGWFARPLWQQIAFAFVAGIIAGFFLGEHATTWLKPFGDLYLNLVRLLVVPLIFFTVTSSMARLSAHQMMRFGVRTLVWFMITSALAVLVGLAIALLLKPGVGISSLPLGQAAPKAIPSFVDVLLGIVPSNVIRAFSETNVLQVLFISGLFGAVLVSLNNEVTGVKVFLREGELIVFRATRFVLKLTPLGTFGLIGWVVGHYGLASLLPLGTFIGAMYCACLVHIIVVYGALLRGHRVNPWRFFKLALPAQHMAFVSSSSMATLPVSLDVAVNRLGVPSNYASFALPLGANLKMDGCGAIYPTISALFVAQYFGIELTLTHYGIIGVTAVLGSLATAGVPGTSVVMLTMTLSAAGLPLEGIGHLVAIDRVVDMIRTATNVTGQLVVPVLVAKAEGVLDETIFDGKTQGRTTDFYPEKHIAS